MLRRFQARGFKSLREVDFELSPLVVLFGPNSAGKSNLIEAMALLSRMATASTLGEAFSEAVRGRAHEAFALPRDGLSGLLARDRVMLEMEADIEPPDGTYGYGPLRYGVGVALRPRTGELSLASEHIQVLRKDGEPKTGTPGSRLEVQDGELLARHRTTAGRERRDPLGSNHTSLANRQLSGPMWPEWDVLRDELAAWRTYYLDPRDAMRREQPPQEVGDIGPRGEKIAPLLWAMKNSNGGRAFKAVERALASAIPSVEKLDVELDDRRGSLEISITQDGTPFSSRVISEGTLRLLALCALVASPASRGLVAFEEPENGVHPRRLEIIANLLIAMARRGRQVVITTHSSQLAALLAQRQLEQEDRTITLYAVSHDGTSTRLRSFEPSGALFGSAEVQEALSSPSEDRVIHEMMLRGWLDG